MEGIIYKHYLDMINSEPYIELHKYYTQETIFDILNVARQENPHSNYLRWLFSADSSHGLGLMPLQKLLQTVFLAKEKIYENIKDTMWDETTNLLHPANDKYCEALKYGNCKISEVCVKNETVLEKQRRADVFISCKIQFAEEKQAKYLVVLIENKVTSSENKARKAGEGTQTEEYAKFIFRDGNDETSVYRILKDIYKYESDDLLKDPLRLCIYLNPFKSKDIKTAIEKKKSKKLKESVIAESNQFITMNYQYLLDGVIEPAYLSCQNPLERYRLEEYIRCLGQDRMEISEQGKTYLVMALSSKEKKYARELWDNPAYQKVMESIYHTMSVENNPGFDEKELPFWFALANVYSIVMDEYEKDTDDPGMKKKIKDFKDLLDSLKKSDRQTSYEYTRLITGQKERYKSFSVKNIGLLCHDMIEDIILLNKWNRAEVEELRQKMQQRIKLNWLREIILFDDEVDALAKVDNKTTNQTGKYSTPDIIDFAGSFFSYLHEELKKDKTFDPQNYDKEKDDDLAIKLPDGSKVYVAKFWTNEFVSKLIGFIKETYNIDVECRTLNNK